MTKVIIYDCEIKHCIPDRKKADNPAYKYCNGWNDYIGMGISVIAAFDFETGRYRIFLEDNFSDFQDLVDSADMVVGFNSLSFDDSLARAHGISVTTNYDLLCEIRAASGQPRNFTPGKTRGGYQLGELSKATFGQGKAEKGESAPQLWQDGQIGRVIDYCLDDARLTRKVLMAGILGNLVDPTNGQKLLIPDVREVWRDLQSRSPQGVIGFE